MFFKPIKEIRWIVAVVWLILRKKGQCLPEWNERSEWSGGRHLTLCFWKSQCGVWRPFYRWLLLFINKYFQTVSKFSDWNPLIIFIFSDDFWKITWERVFLHYFWWLKQFRFFTFLSSALNVFFCLKRHD